MAARHFPVGRHQAGHQTKQDRSDKLQVLCIIRLALGWCLGVEGWGGWGALCGHETRSRDIAVLSQFVPNPTTACMSDAAMFKPLLFGCKPAVVGYVHWDSLANAADALLFVVSPLRGSSARSAHHCHQPIPHSPLACARSGTHSQTTCCWFSCPVSVHMMYELDILCTWLTWLCTPVLIRRATLLHGPLTIP